MFTRIFKGTLLIERTDTCLKLSVSNISKSFGEKTVLSDVNFSVESGSAMGFLGRNGAGKTTTIRIIMGVFSQDSGSVLIDGNPIDRSRLRIGYLPEERGLYPKKNILDQVVYFGRLRGMSKKTAIKSCDTWLERLQMTEYRNRRLDTLSKGNQQKIQLIAALVADPEIVILDEPFSGLDPVNAMLLKDVVKELIAAGKIVLFSSHQMNYVEEFCNNIAILNDGKVVISGDTYQIKHSYDRDKIVVTSKDIAKIKDFLPETSYIKNGELIVKLKSADNKAQLLSRLTNSEFDLDGMRVYEPSLGDIFVEYTEDKA